MQKWINGEGLIGVTRIAVPNATSPAQSGRRREMSNVLSYGGGVNSTAIIALAKMGKLPMPDHVVFSDTGAEYPYTYAYLDYLESQGIHITYLTGGSYRTKEQNWETLIEYCQRKGIIPSIFHRWCSMDWKVRPIDLFREGNEYWVGIDAGEAHRAEKRHGKGIWFPLIELKMDREACKKVIRDMGWGVPLKSGCYVCPYQSRKDWINLRERYPDLYQVARHLEAKSRVTFVHGYTLDEYTEGADKQMTLGVVPLDQKCECFFD